MPPVALGGIIMAKKKSTSKRRTTSAKKKSASSKGAKTRKPSKGSSTLKKPIKKPSQHPSSRLTKAEKIAKIPIENMARKSGSDGLKELRDAVRTLRMSYKRRVQSLAKKGLVSHAQISLEESISGNEKPVSSMTRNQLLLDFARYSKFFNDKTSSEKGIREVNREQDARIFGTAPGGKPVRQMTNKEREKFWSVYDEYKNLHPGGIAVFSSESIQKAVGEIVGGVDSKPFMEVLEDVHQKLLKEYESKNSGSVPNVYSGRGTD